jgi:hypothetical protein
LFLFAMQSKSTFNQIITDVENFRFVFNQKLNWVDEILVVPVYWEWLIRFWLADKFSFRRFSSSLTKYRQLNLLLNYC